MFKGEISITQRKYVIDLLIETGMLGCKTSDTPVDVENKVENSSRAIDTDRYQQLAAELIYLSHTRPDIAFTVSVVSQHMHCPKEVHLEAIYKILRYHKCSPGRGLFFKRDERKDVKVLQMQIGQVPPKIEGRSLDILLLYRKI